MLNFKGMRLPADVILVCIRWYVAYPLTYRHIEEMMEEPAVSVDHTLINRWTIRFLPLGETMPRKHKCSVGSNWRMDETYIKVKGVWEYLYRAVDKQGKTVDFLLTAERDTASAKRCFNKGMVANSTPSKVTMDNSGATRAAIDEINAGREVLITVRQVKYFNKIVEQDHRAIKRVTRPMLGLKSFCSASTVLAGIELMHMIHKSQFSTHGVMSLAEQFYALAGQAHPVRARGLLSME
jgi:putative transposase